MCEAPSVYEELVLRARKNHTCEECRGQILKGETYIKISGLWDGHWGRFKTCLDCHHLREELGRNVKHYEDKPYLGGLFEYCNEIGKEGMVKILAIMQKRGAPIKDWMRKYLDQQPPICYPTL